jgi:hypothetical protein
LRTRRIPVPAQGGSVVEAEAIHKPDAQARVRFVAVLFEGRAGLAAEDEGVGSLFGGHSHTIPARQSRNQRREATDEHGFSRIRQELFEVLSVKSAACLPGNLCRPERICTFVLQSVPNAAIERPHSGTTGGISQLMLPIQPIFTKRKLAFTPMRKVEPERW